METVIIGNFLKEELKNGAIVAGQFPFRTYSP